MSISNSVFSQKYTLKNVILRYKEQCTNDSLDSIGGLKYTAIDVTIKGEKFDVLKTNFILKKYYPCYDCNTLRIFVALPEKGSQPLVITSNNYEECTVYFSSKLAEKSLYTVNIFPPIINTNYIKNNPQMNVDTTKIDLVVEKGLYTKGVVNDKTKLETFKYVGQYQNKSLKDSSNYTAIDINLKREEFDIVDNDSILQKIQFPGKIRIVVQLSERGYCPVFVVKPKHYNECVIKDYTVKMLNKSLYSVNLYAPPIELIDCDTCETLPPPPPPTASFDTKLKQLGFQMIHIDDKKYSISKYEITNAQFELVMGYDINKDIVPVPKGKGIGAKLYPNYPKTLVTWYEAMEFCRRLGDSTGRHFSLPTVQQWEYAALGGQNQDKFMFAGSDNIDDFWYEENAQQHSHDVFLEPKKANSLGIFGMTGNVKEWCMDNDGEDNKITKGGSFKDGHNKVDTYLRIIPINGAKDSTKKTSNARDLGFRVICEP